MNNRGTDLFIDPDIQDFLRSRRRPNAEQELGHAGTWFERKPIPGNGKAKGSQTLSVRMEPRTACGLCPRLDPFPTWMFIFGILVGRGIPLIDLKDTSYKADLVRFLGWDASRRSTRKRSRNLGDPQGDG